MFSWRGRCFLLCPFSSPRQGWSLAITLDLQPWPGGLVPRQSHLLCEANALYKHPGHSQAASSFLTQEEQEFLASLGSIQILGQPGLCNETVL